MLLSNNKLKYKWLQNVDLAVGANHTPFSDNSRGGETVKEQGCTSFVLKPICGSQCYARTDFTDRKLNLAPSAPGESCPFLL